MAIITLISDWHNDDYYVGAIKGMLYGQCPDVRIIDITHQIDSYKFTQAAFVIRNIYKHYPKGTIHVIGINAEYDENKPPLIVKVVGQYFIGAADNLFGMMFEENPEMVVKLQENDILHDSTFPELTMYSAAAAYLANGGNMEELGENITHQFGYMPLMPVFDEFTMNGSVIYIDSYKNCVTNITRDLFEQIRNGRNFVITIKKAEHQTQTIHKHYNEVDNANTVAVFNSIGYLELALRNAPMATLLSVRLGDPVNIRFF